MNRTAALSLINSKNLTNDFVFAVMGSILLWVSAKVQVAFWPVPMTLQTLAVVTLPIIFGPRAGVGAVMLYMLEGVSGLPVFAGTPQLGLGVAYMAGPTGGYLAGFLTAAVIIAMLVPVLRMNFLNGVLLATLGHIIIFACGISWLSSSIGLQQAIATGFVPFMTATVLKVLVAGCIVKLMHYKGLGPNS
jgi:biotin transport system substrate-specific component